MRYVRGNAYRSLLGNSWQISYFSSSIAVKGRNNGINERGVSLKFRLRPGRWIHIALKHTLTPRKEGFTTRKRNTELYWFFSSGLRHDPEFGREQGSKRYIRIKTCV